MSFSFVATVMLVGSSAVIAFVLQPPKEELQAPANAPVSYHRCQREPLQSIRKRLLSELNLQSEPQFPAGGLDHIRKQWRRTFDNIAGNAERSAVQVVADAPTSRVGGSDTSLKCCHLESEVFMTELGWDSWVIHPPSLTIVTCALCDPQGSIVQCPAPQPSPQNPSQPTLAELVLLSQHLTESHLSFYPPANRNSPQRVRAQTPPKPSCCQPSAVQMVPVVYMDAYGALTMASMQLPSRCSCGSGGTEPSSGV